MNRFLPDLYKCAYDICHMAKRPTLSWDRQVSKLPKGNFGYFFDDKKHKIKKFLDSWELNALFNKKRAILRQQDSP